MAARAGFSGYDKKSTSNDLGNKSNEVSAESGSNGAVVVWEMGR